MSSLASLRHSIENCFISSCNEVYELMPISRGMHVTHNGVNELSKTQPKFLGWTQTVFSQARSQRVNLCGPRRRFAPSWILRPRNLMSRDQTVQESRAVNKTKVVSRSFLSSQDDIQLMSRQATFDIGISVFQIPESR
jgi:hypothetical protein